MHDRAQPGRPGAAEAFERGNYATAALHGSPDDWQTYAAHGLIGNAQRALAGLVAFNTPESLFYQAVTHWIDGDEAAAKAGLEACDTPHAQALLALIQKPRIRVLAHCDRGSQWDIITSIRKDPKFEVINVGFSPNDTANKAAADVCEFFDPAAPPDFYIAKMVEWHLLPTNLQSLPCPLFGHTADYDLHIQTVRPWLALFDELLTTDHTEWSDVSQLTESRVTVFPKAFSISANLPVLEKGLRPMDVFISGTTFHPYHPDKARLLHQLLRRDDLNAQFVEGFLPLADYFKILGVSRAAFTFIRHPGGMPTRGMEALAMGAAIAVQKESILRAYLSEEEGVVPYNSDGTDLPDVLARISREWAAFSERAQRGAAFLRKEFTPERTAGQYFRFLTFLAARPRPARKPFALGELRQKRGVFCKGWSWHPRVSKAVRQKSTAGWIQDFEQSPRASTLIDITRELVLEYATWAYAPAALTFSKNYAVKCVADPARFREALALFRIGLQRFPKSLVLRFNAIRAALYLGEPAQVTEALEWAREALAAPTGAWQVHPDEDVMPWDFFSQMFNYRAYFDTCTRFWQTGEEAAPELTRLILASIAYHLSAYPALGPGAPSQRTSALQAARLDSVFPFYSLNAARLLIDAGGPENDLEAERLLIPLAEETMLLFQAYSLLQTQRDAGRTTDPRVDAILSRSAQTRSRVVATSVGREDWGIVPLLPQQTSAPRAEWGSSLGSPLAQAAAGAPVGPDSKPRILYLCLEFSQWQHARRLAYPAGVGLEEGFRALGAELLTLPSVCGLSQEARLAWQTEIRRRCEGQTFDQVWVELVHSEWDDEFWDWLATLAPQRVGLIMESLRYEQEVYTQSPHLLQRYGRVEKRLRYVTHALCIDEADAVELRQQGLQAAWWPQAVPARFILSPQPAPPDRRGVFLGSIYGSRLDWLQKPQLLGLLTLQHRAPENSTDFPAWFDDSQRAWEALLLSGEPISDSALSVYLETWRRIRSESFSLWIEGLQGCRAIVNLPSYVRGYAGRVYEAMAAGVPVVSWAVPERPRTQALFEEGREILLFSREDAESLARPLRRLAEDSVYADTLARAAQSRLRSGHTVEQRVAQILAWTRTGILPDFQAAHTAIPPASTPLPSADLDPATRTSAPLLATLGQVHRCQGDERTAVACLDAALLARPSQREWLLHRIDLALESRDHAAVQRCATQALQGDEAHPHVWRRLAEYCHETGKGTLAGRIDTFLRENASDDSALPLGRFRTHEGSAAAKDSDHDLNAELGWVEALLVRAVAAVAARRPGEQNSGRQPVAALGELGPAIDAFKNGQLATAWTLAEKAIQDRPFHPQAWLLLGQISLHAGDLGRSKQCCAESRRLAPQWKKAKDFQKQLPKKSPPKAQDLPPLQLCVGRTKPTLTVSIITRDEERFIAACLKSVEGVADQVVVLDTGSTDRTVEIARSLGAEVHSFTWCDDFSAARNAALEHARGDWVLSLDADEELVSKTRDRLNAALADETVIAYRLPLADAGKEKEGFHHVPRLFRNAPGVHFSGRIHEHAFGSLEALQQEFGMQNALGKAQLLHHGYTDQMVKERGKVGRNLKLLESALEENPEDVSLLMSYGLDLVRSGQLDAGLESYGKAFQLMSRRPLDNTPPELRERLLTLFASHLMTAQRFQTLAELADSPQTLATGPTASLHLLFGLATYLQQQYADAARHLRQCVSRRSVPSLSPILPDIQTGAPRHILALCLIRMGDKAGAAKQFEESLAETPDALNVRFDFAAFLDQQGKSVPALQHLHAIVSKRPSELAAWRLGAEIALRTPDYLDFALDWSSEATKAFPRDAALLMARGEALTLRGEFAEAEPIWAGLASSLNPKATAARLLCLLELGADLPVLESGTESIISQELCTWFRRLVGFGNEAGIRTLVQRLDLLSTVLPSAAEIIRAVMTEAQAA